jgi:hypothetical protein
MRRHYRDQITLGLIIVAAFALWKLITWIIPLIIP